MTKSELLELLQQVPDDADIRISQPTHDHWRTQLAVDIRDITEETVKNSAYHNDQDAICDEWDEEGKRVWVLG